MRFSIITANYNGAAYLEETIQSILAQREDKDIELEYIVIDGNSTDNSPQIIKRYAHAITHSIIEADTGPANALNKGLQLATGEVIAWLNSDDVYFPGTLGRVRDVLQLPENRDAAICFGGCAIVDEGGQGIRSGISHFKELFFPLSSRFTYQCINYLSQPALFFRRAAVQEAGLLREDMVAAWDYDFILRLWHSGGAARVQGTPLAAFRWHPDTISGQNFRVQFQEEYQAARADTGRFSPQTLVHFFVRWGIVGAYTLMTGRRGK